MIHNRVQLIRSWLMASLIVGGSLLLQNCSSKKESSSETTTTSSDSATAGSDSSVFGRQGDTANNSLNAPEQAPADSASAQGAVVPAEVKVTPKK